jgi:acyl-CoA synthetase (AMP-forming)/AMP-acid ligase II
VEKIMARNPATIIESILGNTRGSGISIAAGLHGPALYLSREEMISRSCAVANLLSRLGVEPGDRVLLMLPTGKPLLVATLGAWIARAVTVILPSTASNGNKDFYRKSLTSIIRSAKPKMVIASEPVLAILAGALPAGTNVLLDSKIIETKITDSAPQDFPSSDDLAHIQYTSGSTSFPKGAAVSHANLAANTSAICERMEATTADKVVSWCPLHHDMGFIGGVLVPLWSRMGLSLIPTEKFLGDPGVWLRTISDFEGTVSVGPTFGYELVGSKVSSRRIGKIDLSHWRYSCIGAEPIFIDTIEKFNRRFAQFGLSSATLKPCYGLAESTVAVTLTSPRDSHKAEWIDLEALRNDNCAEPSSPHKPDTVPIVCVGTPLQDTEVRIAGSDNESLGDRMQGKVLVRGSSVIHNYFGQSESLIKDGWLDTGDLGFKIGEELYITGRVKDVIIRGGVNIHPQEIEYAAQNVYGVRAGRVAAFSCVMHDTRREEVVLVVETRQQNESVLSALSTEIQKRVVQEAHVQIDSVQMAAPGSIPRTTSGKIQRNLCRQMFLDGAFRFNGREEKNNSKDGNANECGESSEDGHRIDSLACLRGEPSRQSGDSAS